MNTSRIPAFRTFLLWTVILGSAFAMAPSLSAQASGGGGGAAGGGGGATNQVSSVTRISLRSGIRIIPQWLGGTGVATAWSATGNSNGNGGSGGGGGGSGGGGSGGGGSGGGSGGGAAGGNTKSGN